VADAAESTYGWAFGLIGNVLENNENLSRAERQSMFLSLPLAWSMVWPVMARMPPGPRRVFAGRGNVIADPHRHVSDARIARVVFRGKSRQGRGACFGMVFRVALGY